MFELGELPLHLGSIVAAVGRGDAVVREERRDEHVGVADHGDGHGAIEQAVEPQRDREALPRPPAPDARRQPADHDLAEILQFLDDLARGEPAHGAHAAVVLGEMIPRRRGLAAQRTDHRRHALEQQSQLPFERGTRYACLGAGAVGDPPRPVGHQVVAQLEDDAAGFGQRRLWGAHIALVVESWKDIRPMIPLNLIRPPRLAPGARVALLAPSGPLLERDDVRRAVELCRALALEPVVMPHASARHGYLAGPDEARLADLNAALKDSAVDAIWCLRGGYGLTRILDRVDFAALAARPIPIIGYSDVTALLLGGLARAGVVTFHAPMARVPMPPFTRRGFERVLRTAEPAGLLEPMPRPSDVLVPRTGRIVTVHGGVAEGPLVGGNLALLSTLVGTPFLPSFDGALLVLEDVGEALYRLDRMLSQLRLAGLLDRVAGAVVGHFTEMDRHTPDGALGLDEILHQYFGSRGIPIAHGVPVGHIDEQWTLPLGVRARFDAGAGTLTLLDAAVT